MLDDAHHVHQPAARDPVVHDMPVRPHPVVRGDFYAEMLYAFGRHQPAPGDAAGEARLLRAEGEMAHARMDAVGADQEIRFGRRAVVEARDDTLALLLQADQPVADMQPLGRHGGAQ